MKIKQRLVIDDPKLLPLAVFHHMFNDITLFYKGQQYSSRIIFDKKGQCARGLEIGGFMYVVPNMYGQDSECKKRMREGEKLLFIIDKSNNQVLGTVENGRVFKSDVEKMAK